MSRTTRVAIGCTAACVGAAVGAYAAYVGTAWLRYGKVGPRGAPAADESDSLLDRFMPQYDVAERHHVHVAAPAPLVLATAAEMDLQEAPIIRAIFKTRELLLGAHPDEAARPKGLLAEMTALGWGLLAETPGREIVVGAVTQPWKADVVFRAVAPDRFESFREPGFVKIAWTLRADPLGPSSSLFRTETRVVATDAGARAKFRWYWARFSPGIVLIRRVALRHLKKTAEKRLPRHN